MAAYSEVAYRYAADHAHRRAVEAARFAGSLPVPSLILDVGCGPGRDLARFRAAGHVVRGVELNPVFADIAAGHAPVFQVDLRRLGSLFPAGCFDGIWCEAALVHLPKADAVQAVADLSRLTCPGGRLMVSVRASGVEGWVDEPDARRWYSVWTAAELAAVACDAGLVVDELIEGSYCQLWATRVVRP